MGNVKRVFGALGNKVTQYDAGKELAPGITASAKPRPHARPHLVRKRYRNGNVLVQADVTAGAATLFVRNPDWQFMFDTDKPKGGGDTQEIYDMAAAEKSGAGYHFPFPAWPMSRRAATVSAGTGAVEPDDLTIPIT